MTSVLLVKGTTLVATTELALLLSTASCAGDNTLNRAASKLPSCVPDRALTWLVVRLDSWVSLSAATCVDDKPANCTGVKACNWVVLIPCSCAVLMPPNCTAVKAASCVADRACTCATDMAPRLLDDRPAKAAVGRALRVLDGKA